MPVTLWAFSLMIRGMTGNLELERAFVCNPMIRYGENPRITEELFSTEAFRGRIALVCSLHVFAKKNHYRRNSPQKSTGDFLGAINGIDRNCYRRRNKSRILLRTCSRRIDRNSI